MSQSDVSLNQKQVDTLQASEIKEAGSSALHSGDCQQAAGLSFLVYTTGADTGDIDYTLKLYRKDGLLDTITGTISATAPIGDADPVTVIYDVTENNTGAIVNSDRYTAEFTFLHTTDYTPVIELGKYFQV